MRRLLAAHPDAEIVGEAASLDEAMDAIQRTAPQLVFLDIELGGGGDGFDLLAALERLPIVVFVTAYAEHAVEAFAVNAVDYLLKPVEPGRLAESLARAERQLDRAPAAEADRARPARRDRGAASRRRFHACLHRRSAGGDDLADARPFRSAAA